MSSSSNMPFNSSGMSVMRWLSVETRVFLETTAFEEEKEEEEGDDEDVDVDDSSRLFVVASLCDSVAL